MKRTVLILAAILVVTNVYLGYSLMDKENKIKHLNTIVEGFEREVKNLRKNLEEKTDVIEALKRDLCDLRNKLDYLRREREELLLRIRELEFSRSVEYKVIGVNESTGKGEIIGFEVVMRKGEGGLFVNITNVILGKDTQQSIIKALDVAKNVTKEDLKGMDLFVHFAGKNGTFVIVGPSAGAAICVATIALIENKSLNESVLITGTIESDGTIGRVGDILKKAEAARDYGARVFLVPKGQGIRLKGLTVVEVESIYDVMKYVLSDSDIL